MENKKAQREKNAVCTTLEDNQWRTSGITDTTDRLLQQSQTILSNHYHKDIVVKQLDGNENEYRVFLTLPKIGVRKDKKFNAPLRKKLLQAMIDFRKQDHIVIKP